VNCGDDLPKTGSRACIAEFARKQSETKPTKGDWGYKTLPQCLRGDNFGRCPTITLQTVRGGEATAEPTVAVAGEPR